MAVEIDSELLDFKAKVSGKTGAMKSAINTLGDMFSTVVAANSNARDEISSVYKTPNSPTVLSSFDSLNSSIESASSGITEKIAAVIAKAEDLIAKIGKLEALKGEIDAAEAKIKSARAKLAAMDDDDPGRAEQVRIINENTTIVKEKTTEFNTSQEAAKAILANLKATDGTAPTIS